MASVDGAVGLGGLIPGETATHKTVSFYFQTARTPLRALLTVCVALYAVLTGLFGVQALAWGRSLGKRRGDSESRALFGGGVGGAMAGSLFVAISVVLIEFTIISRQTRDDNAISSTTFHIVLAASGIVGAAVGARWQWVGRAFVGLTGATAMATIIAMTLHMTTLLPKMVLICTLLALSVIGSTLLRMPSLSPKTSTRCICVLSACTGAWLFACAIDFWTRFGIVDAITLFITEDGLYSKTGPQPYESVVHWSQTKVKGLLAGVWILAILMSAFQFWFYTEDPDESWNKFLSHVIATEEDNTGNAINGKAGLFTPRRNFFGRLFGRKQQSMPLRRSAWDHKSEKVPTEDTDWLADPPSDPFADNFGKSASKPPCRYDAVSVDDTHSEFGQLPMYGQPSSSSPFLGDRPRLPSYRSKPSLSSFPSKPIIDTASQRSFQSPLGEVRSVSAPVVPTTNNETLQKTAFQPKPGTVRRAVKSLFGEERPPVRFARSPSGSERSFQEEPERRVAPVPATPSLIKAIERISAAQREAIDWRQRQAIEEVDDDEEARPTDGYAALWQKIEKKASE